MRFRRMKLIATFAVWAGLFLLVIQRFAVVENGRQWMSRKTVADRVSEYGVAVRARLAPMFERVGAAYPPACVTLIGLKQERRLEVWVNRPSAGADRLAADSSGPPAAESMVLLTTYPVLGASGGPGPKLREGDHQVPEGFYSIESLNPNSAYHLSLRIGYPNAEDRARAANDGRTNPGGDIMIHGGASSVGCLAMGDEVAEDLFVLAAEAGIENIRVILSPLDFRRAASTPSADAASPIWISGLYDRIGKALSVYGPSRPSDG